MEVREEIGRAAALAAASPYAVYIILDPSQNDPLGRHPEPTGTSAFDPKQTFRL